MDRSPRILVASPLARIITPALVHAFPSGAVEEALDRDDVRRQVAGRVRFDVVIADLVWNHPDLEYSFDGLDVLDILRAADRRAPVILATQGHTIELDLLDEARLRPEIAAVFPKSVGTAELSALVRDAAVGRRHIAAVPASRKPPLYEAFRSRKGQTAGRLAGAIAAGRGGALTASHLPPPRASLSTPRTRSPPTISGRSSSSVVSTIPICR